MTRTCGSTTPLFKAWKEKASSDFRSVKLVDGLHVTLGKKEVIIREEEDIALIWSLGCSPNLSCQIRENDRNCMDRIKK